MNGDGTKDFPTVTTDSVSESAGTSPTDAPAAHQPGTTGVVVGYDGSAQSRLALDWAAAMARRRGSRLTLLHSVNVNFTPGFSAIDMSELGDEVQDAAHVLLENGALQARHALDASCIQTQHSLGSPASQLVDASNDADLVVVGSRGRGRITGGLLGSTSYAVAAHAHCPVVVVRSPQEADELTDAEVPEGPSHTAVPQVVLPDATHPVVVAFDDSEQALRAVEAAADIAVQEEAELRVVHVVHVPSIDSWAYEETAHAGTVHAHSLREKAEDALSGAVRLAERRQPDLSVTAEVLYGDPGRAIADLGQTAGLIVVGSRGRGGFTGLLLGSVSHNVIHHAVCPVMVVR